MFLVKAGTLLTLPKNPGNPTYITKEDRLYDKNEVWDAVGVCNGREDIPDWAKFNIQNGYVVLNRQGKYAMLSSSEIEFLD